MKLLLLFSIIAFQANSQNWEQLNDFPGTERDDAVAFKLGNSVYYGTGMDAGFQTTGDFYRFDLLTETWWSSAPLPAGEERQYACSFVHSGKAYLFGGIDGQGNALNDLWSYSPQTNAWTPLFGLPAAGRSGSVCFSLADTVYLIGGKTQNGQILSEVWAYVVSSNGWSQRASLPTEIWRGISFAYNGEGYAGLGAETAGLNTMIYRYNSALDAWETVPQLILEPRTYGQTAMSSNQLYVFAGQDAQGYRSSLERIDLSTWVKTDLADFPDEARRGGSSFAHGTDFYTVGGVSLLARQKETWVARGALALDDISVQKSQVSAVGHKVQVSTAAWNELVLIDALGREFHFTNCEALNMAEFTAGIYYYQLLTETAIYSGKLALL